VSEERSVSPGQITCTFYDKDRSSWLFRNVDGCPLCIKVAVFSLFITSLFISSSFWLKAVVCQR